MLLKARENNKGRYSLYMELYRGMRNSTKSLSDFAASPRRIRSSVIRYYDFDATPSKKSRIIRLRVLKRISLKKNPYPERKRATEKVMDDLCVKCSGFCCETFFIGKFGSFKTMDDIINYMKSNQKDYLEKDTEFMAKNFIDKNPPEFPADRGVELTCLKFDTKTRMCTAYEDRPSLCKSFRCNTVTKGKLPEYRDPNNAEPITRIEFVKRGHWK